ncbi:MAG: tetratricopeptide repeat protein, partial [Chloroflexales bacterium]|nr:tetratricopeptide repeat protein [Chloroflexales bacterium]
PPKPASTAYDIELLNQLARAQGLQRNFAAAHQTLDKAENLLTDDLPGARVRCLLERGRVFNTAGQPEQARPLFLAAWELARTCGVDYHAIDAAHMLGIVEAPEQQLAWSLRALELADTTSDQRSKKWLGSLYNNIGWNYHDLGQFDQALAIFQRALQWREVQGSRPETRIARWCIARTLRSLGRLDEALALQQALQQELTGVGTTDGYVLEELAECLLALDRAIEAQPYFRTAYAELSQDAWLVEHESARLERLKALGK